MPLSDDELMEMKKEITLLHDVECGTGAQMRGGGVATWFV